MLWPYLVMRSKEVDKNNANFSLQPQALWVH